MLNYSIRFIVKCLIANKCIIKLKNTLQLYYLSINKTYHIYYNADVSILTSINQDIN